MPTPSLYRCALPAGHAMPALQFTPLSLASRLFLGGRCERRLHLPLCPPFFLKRGVSPVDLREAVEAAAGENHFFSYLVTGFATSFGPRGGRIGYRVRPSPALQAFHRSLVTFLDASAVCPTGSDGLPGEDGWCIPFLAGLKEHEYEDVLSALAITEESPSLTALRRFEKYMKRVSNSPGVRERATPLVLPLDAFQIDLERQGRVFSSYDLPHGCWDQHHGPGHPRNSRRSLRSYRLFRGFEIPAAKGGTNPEAWVASDLHLGHPRIIRSSARPFHSASPGTMDQVLIRNWNRKVRPGETVYFLGDLCGRREQVYGRATRWLGMLNGEICFIAGNHDLPAGLPESILHLRTRITFDGIPFELVHNPRDATPGFPGWIIHGHVHNTRLHKYPFFDPLHRRVNVSMEVTGYQPVALSLVSDLIQREGDCLLTLV